MEIADVKRNLNKPVWYGGHKYIFTGCMLRRDDNGFYYQAELREQKARAVLMCRLEEVKHEQNADV